MSNQKGKPLLTNREREVFELLVQDKTTKEIAQQLFISEKTVRNHISNVMCTFSGNMNEAARWCYPTGRFILVPADIFFSCRVSFQKWLNTLFSSFL
ncbi:regulatory protein, luxR family [Marininema halotolerans]|uniref:Regulatory protein, luxR family n=1 Tax=Marininema halotolerans TaxID=1155944 RepID=A0A1I6UAW0_9BACL|nr:regulatory protein, luxR family [Marininema halotolerans]